MKRRNQKLCALVALCVLLAPAPEPVLAQRPRPRPADGFVTHGQIAGIAAGIAVAGAAIGIGVYLAVKHNHHVTGCARNGPDGLTLTSESDKLTYNLIGDVAAVKPGRRVRVSGKINKQNAASQPQLLVEKVARDFGPCEVASSSR
jgi:hypothetical protein